jgi:hypothetical protein
MFENEDVIADFSREGRRLSFRILRRILWYKCTDVPGLLIASIIGEIRDHSSP